MWACTAKSLVCPACIWNMLRCFEFRETCRLNEHLMRYREVDYAVVQGLEGQLWKWEVSIEADYLRGKAATKPEAISQAERAIDRALTSQRLKLVPPGSER